MQKKNLSIKVWKFNLNDKIQTLLARDFDIDPSVSIPYESIERVLHFIFGSECYVEFKSNYYGK